LLKKQEEKIAQQNLIGNTPDQSSDTVTLRGGLLSLRCLHITAMLFFGIFYGIYVASVYKTTSQKVLSDRTLTLAGAIGSVCNGGSRIMWATLQDKFGFRKIYAFVMVLQLVVSATVWNVHESAYLYPIWVACSFLGEGAHFSMFPAVTANVFGIEYGGQIFSFIFLSIPVSSFLSFFFVKFGHSTFGQ